MKTDTADTVAQSLRVSHYRSLVRGDKMMERAVADLMSKGTDELRALIIVVNTFND